MLLEALALFVGPVWLGNAALARKTPLDVQVFCEAAR